MFRSSESPPLQDITNPYSEVVVDREEGEERMGTYFRKNGHNSYVRVEENEAGGCIWALLRILHYHPWRNAKKVLPYKKLSGADRIKTYHNRNGAREREREIGATKAKGIAGGGETDSDSVVECRSSTAGSGSPITKRSRRIKARIKAFMTTEDRHISKQRSSSPTAHNATDGITTGDNKRSPLPSSPSPSAAAAAMSLQDLLALTARVKLISSSTETVRPKTSGHSPKQQLRMSSSTRALIKDNYADIHELFKANNKLLLDLLCDESDATLVTQLLGIGNDAADQRMRSPPATGARLIKSGSYPSPNSPRMGFMPATPRHAKLEYKHNEAWPLRAAGASNKFSAAINETSRLEDHLSLIRCRGRENGTTSVMMRRTSSLTESAERYSQLFDLSSGSRREINSHYLSTSRSLRLRDYENERSWFDSTDLHIFPPTSHGRRGSFGSEQLDRFPFSLFQNHQAPPALQREEEHGADHGRAPCAEEINNPVGAPEDNDTDSVSTSSSELPDETACSGSSIPKTCFHRDQVGVHISEASAVMTISSPDQSDLTLPDNTTVVTSHPDHHPNLQIGSKDPPDTSCNNDHTLQHHHHHHHHITNNSSTAAEFGYVKYVLEHCGFTNKHQLSSWYSLDHHPLSPTLFRQVEGTCGGGASCCGISSSHCDRKILFDLINEGLTGNVYEKSYPNSLIFGCGIHPGQPFGDRVVEEVWRFVSGYLNWTPEVGTLIWESLTAYDLCKNDHGWMNLRMDSESVGIVIEEIIFDELLDEILSS